MKITEVILYTSKHAELKHFYGEILNMELKNVSENEFSVQTGSSLITFKTDVNIKDPFYHFAFNIPENQFSDAKEWAKQRVALIRSGDEDEFNFKSWNAHSVYFYDPAGNIIELIARHNMKNTSQKKFSNRSFLSVSEIGMPVYDVEIFSKKMMEDLGIEIFSGDMKTFVAAGDNEGLFIIVPGGRKWFPDCQNAEIFSMIVKVISSKVAESELQGVPYKIISSSLF